METLRLLVTELVTNSVRHTECDEVTLRVAVGRSAVLTEVADEGPAFDPDKQALEDPDRGWGLFLVQARAEVGRQEGRRLEARLVRAPARLESQLPFPNGEDRRARALLPEQRAEALRGGASSPRLLLNATCTSPALSASSGAPRRSPRARRRCTATRSARRPSALSGSPWCCARGRAGRRSTGWSRRRAAA